MQLRSKKRSFYRRSALCSIILHSVIFGVSFFSFFKFNKADTVFMDVEIAGEGELKEALNEKVEQPLPFPKQEELKPEIVKPKPEIVKSLEKREGEKPLQTQKSEPRPTEKVEEGGDQEEKNTTVDKKIEQDPVPQLVKPKPQKVKKDKPKSKPKPKPEKKSKKKKGMLDVIKRIEKQEKKKRSTEKLHEIANASKKNDEFKEMLNNEVKEIRKHMGKGKVGDGSGQSGVGAGIAEGDFDIISSQIYPHWNVSGGVKNAENIIIDIRVKLKETGEVIPSSIEILNKKRYAEDYIFRAAADSAKHAILEASPLKIPRDKMNMFKNFVVRFNLKEALGG